MVVGFIILIGLVVYLIISIAVIYFGVRYARKKNIPGWKGGVLAAIVMYLLMFWDFIPFHISHKYYCTTEGGFTINKTLEEWMAENPGVAETLTHKRSSDYTKSGNKEKYVLNQRFVWEIITTRKFLGLVSSDNRIVDTGTGELMAQYIDFSSGQSSLSPDEFRDFKFWIYVRACESDNENLSRSKFHKYENEIYHLGSIQE